jgi:hypothetical protein
VASNPNPNPNSDPNPNPNPYPYPYPYPYPNPNPDPPLLLLGKNGNDYYSANLSHHVLGNALMGGVCPPFPLVSLDLTIVSDTRPTV